MLRLKQTLRRPVLCARGVKTWHKDLEAPLKRVGARIDAALQVLHGRSGGGIILRRSSCHSLVFRSWQRCAPNLSNGDLTPPSRSDKL